MKVSTFSVILHLISGLNAEAIADSEGLEIFQPILPVQVDLSMITDILAELKENMKTVMTQTKAMENRIKTVEKQEDTLTELKENMKTVTTQTKTMENQIKTVEKQVQNELDLKCTSNCELEDRPAALEKKILEPINPTKPVAPTIPVTPTKAIIPTKSPVDPITGLKWSAILGGCVKPKDENGWILLQRRDATAKNAFATKNWNDYKNGFQEKGVLAGKAYWLGLQEMHEKTSTGKWEVAIVYHCEGEEIKCVVNEDFKVDSENMNFKLNVGPEVQHKGIDSEKTFSYSNNMPFTTIDRDNDQYDHNCAKSFYGGWWHERCYMLCPNCDPTLASVDCARRHTFMAMKNVKEVQ